MNGFDFGARTALGSALLLAACAGEPERPSIEGIVESSASLSTFAAALDAAEVSETLARGGPYTLFAPVNSAFEVLPPTVLEDLLRPENQPEMRRVLRAHIVPGRLAAADLAGSAAIVSLDGTTFTVAGSDPLLLVGAGGGAARVVRPDLEAANGVVHVIDGILLP